MGTAKKFILTMAAGVAVGTIIGMLYAPEEGAETRRKLAKLKRKFTCCDEDIDNAHNDKESLEELKRILESEVSRINEKLEKMA